MHSFNISSIICEFNPLHFGHKSILEYAGKTRPVVCVMSGNYVQRGEPAIIDKWARTKMALQNGADLVLELPLPWAVAGAERFAAGAVYILSALNLPGSIVFGSECGDTKPLTAIAEALRSEAYNRAVSGYMLQNGNSYAQNRELVIAALLGGDYAEIMQKPNNILGIEYSKALLQQHSHLTPQTIKRIGANHGEFVQNGVFSSAQQIRAMLYAGEAIEDKVPESVSRILLQLFEAGSCPVRPEKLETAILCRLRTMQVSDLAALPDISEGLEYRLHEAIKQAVSLTGLYKAVKTRRYSLARLRRIVLSAFLGITKELPALPPYIRILGMTDTGEQILRNAKPTLPIAARARDFAALGGDALALFELEATADDLYALALDTPGPCGMDYTKKLVRL